MLVQEDHGVLLQRDEALREARRLYGRKLFGFMGDAFTTSTLERTMTPITLSLFV
jgi:hypothetical protein